LLYGKAADREGRLRTDLRLHSVADDEVVLEYQAEDGDGGATSLVLTPDWLQEHAYDAESLTARAHAKAARRHRWGGGGGKSGKEGSAAPPTPTEYTVDGAALLSEPNRCAAGEPPTAAHMATLLSFEKYGFALLKNTPAAEGT
jgi:hypothetical protein